MTVKSVMAEWRKFHFQFIYIKIDLMQRVSFQIPIPQLNYLFLIQSEQ